MILRLILIAFIIYLLYKAFGGKFALPKKASKDEQTEANTLVECTKCGVYITYKEAVKKSGKIYCSDCA
jgi:protein-arginine kinase activator protein McsA